MNSFNQVFRFSSFGESHGKAIGCIIDGVPSGLELDYDKIRTDLTRRGGGKNSFVTPRKEADNFEVLSGIFEGKTTGTPIGIIVFNEDKKSRDYKNIKDLFRPSHADFTYFHKYGIRDYKGGGRSSARESVVRVIAGAIAKQILDLVGVKIRSGIFSVGEIDAKSCDFANALSSEIYALDKDAEEQQKRLIKEARSEHDSIGGSVVVEAINMPIGLGEPLFGKIDGDLAGALMGINGVKAVEIGQGIAMSKMRGSRANDEIGTDGFMSNFSGGIQGGISNGEDIRIRVFFKPTPSISKPQKTIDIHGKEVSCNLSGRHDPCIAIRGSIVCEAMMACVIVDKLLLNMHAKIENVVNLGHLSN